MDRPMGFQEVEAPRFEDNRHIILVRLSALSTGRLYTQEISWYSCLLVTPIAIVDITHIYIYIIYILFNFALGVRNRRVQVIQDGLKLNGTH
jgi:hypothetical protein